MPETLPFAKMHGCQNDYVVLAARAEVVDVSTLAQAMCDRRTGVGADGLLLVGPSAAGADFRMRMFNVDGSEAEMCGNGLRCAARFAVDRGLAGPGPALRAETGAGILDVLATRGASDVVVDLGAPLLPAEGGLVETLEVLGRTVEFTPIRLGNPHAVLFVESVLLAPVADLGPLMEVDPRFPDRTNVEFVEVVGRGEVRQRTWERGCGETLACGTGACAVVVAGAVTGRTDRRVRVRLLGGDLEVEWTPAGTVRMTGPAEHVFDGEWLVRG